MSDSLTSITVGTVGLGSAALHIGFSLLFAVALYLLYQVFYGSRHIGAGIQSVRLKQMDKATEHLTQAVTLKPDFVEAYLLLAAIHDQAGRKEEAKKYLDLASLFRPGPQS